MPMFSVHQAHSALMMGSLDRSRGSYLLLLRLEELSVLPVGSLGLCCFAQGWYIYVGSALGSGGVRGRLAHHLAPVRRPHWHIDALRTVAAVEEVWYQYGTVTLEHLWAAALAQEPGAQIPVPRFGASDCRCAAHLFYFAQRPVADVLRRLVDEGMEW